MRNQSYFSKERSIYWPGEFADVVNFLTGRNKSGELNKTPPVYQFNTGAITFAASVGLWLGRKREFGSNDRKEISTSTFASHKLEMYIFLVAMLGMDIPNVVELLRPEREDDVIRLFESYAAAGLEYLRTEFDDNPTQSVDLIIEKIIQSKLPGPGITGVSLDL